jgi:Fe-S cluster biosynthesis and repair protein YggX
MRILTLLLFILCFGEVSAQLPNTDLYMFTLLNNGDKISLKDPVYLSGFNPDGYNNQPYFINPSEVYITSNYYNKDFTDFMKLDIQNEEFYRITATDSISEYSPTPKAISGYFSAVRVEKDGATQSFWLYPNDHLNYGKRIFKDISNIGYHCWLSENEIAMFLVSTPMKLAIGNLETGAVSNILDDIGRCFQQNADGDLLFVHKVSEDTWYIKSYNVDERRAKTIIQTRPNSEDFVLLPDGTIIMAEGSKIFSIQPESDTFWNEVIDVAELDITDISRIAVSRNRLILVNTKK